LRECISEKGYILTAQNKGDTDYIRLAYSLALSIKASQCNVQGITLITDDPVPERFQWVFDQIQPIWLGDSTHHSNNPYSNEWKVYHTTPYKRTIKLEADMLVLDDLSHVWDALVDYDVCIPNVVYDYRGIETSADYYRRALKENNIYNAFSAFTYFNQSPEAWKFFKMCEKLFTNWGELGWQQLWNCPEKIGSTDVVWGLATTLLGKENEYWCPRNFSFTHMKTLAQGWEYPNLTDVAWTNYGQFRLTDDCQLYVEGYKQSGVFHYVDKNFITDEIIHTYERYLGV
jgi:hypothetical protein